jgi:hypothetical protein
MVNMAEIMGTTEAESDKEPDDLVDAGLLDESVNAVKQAAERNLSDRELVELCTPFVDGSKKRPTFISRPIMNKVYIGTYPAFGEILTAERLLGSPAPDADEGTQMTYKLLSELASVIKGFVFAHDPGLAVISMYPYAYEKWPPLHPVQFLNALHPSMRDIVFPQLVSQYIAWKIAITPTNDELEKYYGLIG